MNENKPKRIIDFTILIAIIPAYIYFVSFEFENGYCNHFGIPKYLIEPSLTTILIFATTIFGILISSIKLLGFSLPFFKAIDKEEKSHLRSINLINGICIFGGILMIYAYPLSWKLIFIIISVTAILNLITWGIPFLFKLRNKKTLKEKLQEVEDDYLVNDDNLDWFVFLMKRFTQEEKIFILLIILIPLISYLFGNGEAMKQEKFEILSSYENTIILKKYNEIFVCAKFNRKTKLLSDSLILIKISDDSPIILKSEKIGQLNIK